MEKYKKLSKEQLLKIITDLESKMKNKYGLVWDSEKFPEQVVLECENNLPVLKEIKGKKIQNCDLDDNILIEGDNYHALTCLNYTHAGKIDMIYIDPPYNTGKVNNGKTDFRYNDDYINNENTYRHSKWLNFMEKRLKLAHKLLKDDGIIFISIDDNEQANLKLLCDKIFGNKNFIATLPTIMNLKGNNDQFGFAGTHEYTIVYMKNSSFGQINHFNVDEEGLEKWKEDKIGLYKKGANLKATGGNAPKEKRPNLFYPIFIEGGTNNIYVTDNNKAKQDSDRILLPITDGKEMSWRWSKGKIEKDLYDIILVGNKGTYSLYKKQRPELGDLPSRKPKTIFYKAEYSSGNGTGQLKTIFSEKIFNNPKPIELIKDFIFLGSNKNSIILDFMAGSGTTGHAVIDLNREDGGNRKFILCTNNENKICEEVTYLRLEKVIKGYTDNKGKKIEGLGGNLRYFKTSLVKKTKSRSQLKIDITKRCSEMLCLKEGIFNLKLVKDNFKIFYSNKKDKFLGIYYNFIQADFEDFINEFKKVDGEIIIYVFTIDNKINKSFFKGLNVRVEPIPQKILEVYKSLAKMNISQKSETIFVDFEKANKRIFEEKDKDDGASKLRIVLEKILQKLSQLNGLEIINNKGKHEKAALLNDLLKKKGIFNQIVWQKNQIYLTIGNKASHGDCNEYVLKDVEDFYKHVQNLIDKFNI